MVHHYLLSVLLALRSLRHLPELDRFACQFGHVVNQFLPIQSSTHETNGCVLGHGVVQSINSTLEDSAVIYDVGRSGLESSTLDLIQCPIL